MSLKKYWFSLQISTESLGQWTLRKIMQNNSCPLERRKVSLVPFTAHWYMTKVSSQTRYTHLVVESCFMFLRSSLGLKDAVFFFLVSSYPYFESNFLILSRHSCMRACFFSEWVAFCKKKKMFFSETFFLIPVWDHTAQSFDHLDNSEQ